MPSFLAAPLPLGTQVGEKWRANGVMIGKMIEGRLKFPSSVNHASSAPEKTLAANGVR